MFEAHSTPTSPPPMTRIVSLQRITAASAWSCRKRNSAVGFSILMFDEYDDPVVITRESYGTTARSDPTSTKLFETLIAKPGTCELRECEPASITVPYAHTVLPIGKTKCQSFGPRVYPGLERVGPVLHTGQ